MGEDPERRVGSREFFRTWEILQVYILMEMIKWKVNINNASCGGIEEGVSLRRQEEIESM